MIETTGDEALRRVRLRLTDIERTVILHRFGIAESSAACNPISLEQTGQIIGVTKERVRQIQNNALGKMVLVLLCCMFGCASTRITYTTPDGTSISYSSGKDQDWSVTLPDGHVIRVQGTASTVEAQRWATVVSLAELLRSLAPPVVP